MNRVSRMVLGLALAAWPMAASAQSTVITPDVGARGLGTTVTGAGAGVTIDGGTLAGANLFHSFSQFDLGAGATAQWTRAAGDAGAVRNVINRVTGGQASQIGGTLDSTGLPNASFYFINPAGIVFGAGARVNVPAAAYFSTAAELRFADGATFAVATPGGSTLSVAAPESFGFVGGQGAIQLDGAELNVGDARMSFAASDIDVSGGRVFGGGLDFTAVGAGPATVAVAAPPAAAAGEITIRGSQVAVLAASGPLRMTAGAIVLDGSNLVSSTETLVRGGDIEIQAGSLTTRGSTLGVSTQGPGASGDLMVNAGSFVGDGGSIFSVGVGSGRSGRLALTADTIELRGGLAVASTHSGTARGGDVAVTATRELTLDSAFVVSSSLGTARGGDLTLTAPTLNLFNALAVTSSTENARPGNVMITGETILTSGGAFGSAPGGSGDSGDLTILASKSFESSLTSFVAATLSDNQAGSILIRSPLISMESSFLTSSAFGRGGAGKVQLQGTDIFLNSTQLTAETRGADVLLRGLVELKATGRLELFLTFLTSDANGQGNGGMVSLEGGDIVIDNSFVTSDAQGDGSGGLVKVNASRSLALHLGEISSSATFNGDAGDVVVNAPRIFMDQNSKIRSDAEGFVGNAGSVNVKVGTLELTDGSTISSDATGGFGNAGQVNIDADNIRIVDAVISSSAESFGDAGAVKIRATGDLIVESRSNGVLGFITSETVSDGNAGDVIIDARNIELRGGAYLSSSTFQDAGNAGLVDIRATSLTLSNGSFIASDTSGDGRAGNVNVTADTIRLTGDGDFFSFISSDTFGSGDAGTVSIIASKSLTLDSGSFISSDTLTFANAGDVFIKAGVLTVDNAGISSRTASGGLAGDIVVEAGAVNLVNGGAITTEAVPQSLGDAGFIGIRADTIRLGDMALISTSSSGAGDAGQLFIEAKTSLTLDGGLISSAAERGSTGFSGQLLIEAGELTVGGGGRISTTSFNPRPAGIIDITAGTLRVDGGRSLISSENQNGNVGLGDLPGPGGDAGAVLITADNMIVSNGGRITTNSFGGAAGDIRINIDRPGLLVLAGLGDPGVIQTSSGRATGGMITISDPLAIVSNGGAILALGQQRGANVLIQSRFFINSSDRLNVVAVDGDFTLEAGLDDVSSGTVSRDLSVLDASKVLRGQCPVARSTGQLSQLITRPVGPYAREPAIDVLQAPAARPPLGAGGCP